MSKEQEPKIQTRIHIEVDFISVLQPLEDGGCKQHTFHKKENPGLYRRARKAAEENDLERLFSLTTSLINDLHEIDRRFRMEPDGSIYFDTVKVDNWVTKKIKEDLINGLPVKHWVAFLKNTMANPHAITVEDIHRFLENHEKCPITSDGAILAYKKVQSDYMSFCAGKNGKKERWKPGDTVELPRNECDHDRNRTCSAGLHFCSRGYAPHAFGGSGRIVMVKIFPQDIVAIPVEYGLAKGRCCRAFVLKDIDDYENFEFGHLHSADGEEQHTATDAGNYLNDVVVEEIENKLVQYLKRNRFAMRRTPYQFLSDVHEFFELNDSNFVYDEEDLLHVLERTENKDLARHVGIINTQEGIMISTNTADLA
jgi:hypothetical protein